MRIHRSGAGNRGPKHSVSNRFFSGFSRGSSDGPRRPHARRTVAWRQVPAVVLLLTACALPSADLPAQELPAAGEISLTANALFRAQTLYLYPERLDRRMLIGALNALEARFDPVRFQEDRPVGDQPAAYGTLWVGQKRVRVPIDPEFSPVELARLLGQVVRFVEMQLPEEANRDDDSDVELIALQGALQELDRYSTVFAGRSTEDFKIRFSGKLYGIGTRIGREDGVLKAIEVFEDGPAARAGLIDGDAIETIDGDPTRALSVREAVDRLRGESGTRVRLGISRVDPRLETERQLDVPITRGEVRVPSVKTRDLGDGIGYARINTVSRTTHEEFRSKVLGLQRQIGRLEGLVIDLRGNTGGSMLSAAALADYFVERDTILRIVDRSPDGDGSGKSVVASSQVLFDLPIVVLVDPATASAAEIFSGAIAPLDRVMLVGQRTFGKGLIQSALQLPDEHLLKLTVGEYLLSGDRAIHEKGLDPDVELFPISTLNLGALADRPEGALAYLRDPRADDDRPEQIAKALLREDHAAAIERLREEFDREIADKLDPLGIRWRSQAAIRGSELAQPLIVEGGPVRVLDGTPTRIAIKVSNPNPVEVPDAWAALSGPVEYLRNKLIPLGTIPAGGSAWGEIDVEPEDGLAASPLPLAVHLTSGSHPLQRDRLQAAIRNHAPEIEIEIERQLDQVAVTVRNLGCCGVGTVLVSVPGTARPIEDLAAGSTRSVDLPLSGDVERVSVSLAGAGVSRRIDIPLPEDRVRIVPPVLTLSTHTFLGRSQVRADASSSDGLLEGWLALDGEKEVYVAWGGAGDGDLRADLEPPRSAGSRSSGSAAPNEIEVRTKVETLSGVSMIDVRTLVAD